MLNNKPRNNKGYKTPSNTQNFAGEFIVFFSDEKNPKVIFHSPDPKEAYEKVEEIKEKTGKLPTILHIEKKNTNISSLLAVRL